MVFRGGLSPEPASISEARDRRCAAPRGSATFVEFESYRRFVDEILSRMITRNLRRITAERVQRQLLGQH